MHFLSEIYFAAGRLPEAISLGEESVRVHKVALGVGSEKTRHVMRELAAAYRDAGRVPEAVGVLTDVLAASRKQKELDAETLASMNDLARIHQDTGRIGESITLFQEVVDARKRRNATDPQLFVAMNNLAVAFRDADRLDESIALFKDSVSLGKTALGPDHPDNHVRMSNLAATLVAAKKFADAERLYRDLRGRLGRTPPTDADPELVASVARGLGLTLIRQDRHAEAEPLLREGLAIEEKTSPGTRQRFQTLSVLGESLLGQKRYAEAEPLLLQGYEGLKQFSGKRDQERLSEAVERLVFLYEATGRQEEAQTWRGKLPPRRQASK